MLQGDTAQWLYYEYMRGSGGMYEAPAREEITIGEFGLPDELSTSESLKGGYIYLS